MREYPSSQSLFPAQRAFVVQVAATEPGVPDVPLGRAEHVISGTATHFATWAELVAFIEKVLMDVEQRAHLEGKGKACASSETGQPARTRTSTASRKGGVQ